MLDQLFPELPLGLGDVSGGETVLLKIIPQSIELGISPFEQTGHMRNSGCNPLSALSTGVHE